MSLLTRTRATKPTTPGVLPGAAALLLALRAGGSAGLPGPHPVLAIGVRLGAQHRRQWAAEDRSRRPGASDGELAATKRMIDQLNGLRAGCVDEIDTWCDRALPAGPAEAPLHTETVGSVIDRLAIAVVRAEHLMTGRAAAQLGELAHAYSVLVADLAAGRRRVPSWRTLKAYGTAR
ncbi:DUF4254 domain-containing protein [Amycolatopsis sp. H20-H5]|uniref:DUF4254 domain-containing protein n=1 Tax=Amycolatopsis sp. H20-H5 TaxID=3046309 RepID=UPI002DB78E14|nr:DUF4254 domain-containing protein [Amycolatopsis sp. H20-H5]MEC3980838.1 DUF4254 domain-containing protein [Amycolatopsis sp. H20-H5]